MDIDGLININGDSVQTLEVIFLTTMIMLLPSVVVMMTSFTRYIISFSFLRNALGTQQTPPNMVLIGLALFLTLFTMAPVIDQINEEAWQPYTDEQITQEEFFNRAQVPLKRFMVRNTDTSSLRLFCNMAGEEIPEDLEEGIELPLRVVTSRYPTFTEMRGEDLPAVALTPSSFAFMITEPPFTVTRLPSSPS